MRVANAAFPPVGNEARWWICASCGPVVDTRCGLFRGTTDLSFTDPISLISAKLKAGRIVSKMVV